MGRTERQRFVLGSVVFLLALSGFADGGALAASDAVGEPPSSLDGSPVAFAERVTGGQDHGPGSKAGGSFRTAIELIVLVAVCGIAVAFYSASDGRGGRRVLTRTRRR
jgi:hypothetical protein